MEIEQWRQKYRPLSAVRMPEEIRARVGQALESAKVTELAKSSFRLAGPWLRWMGIAALAGMMIMIICQFGPLDSRTMLLSGSKPKQVTAGQSTTAPLMGTVTDQEGQQSGQPGTKSGQETKNQDTLAGDQGGKKGAGTTLTASAAPCIRPYVLWKQRFYRLDIRKSAVERTSSLIGQLLGSYLNAEIYRIDGIDPQQSVAVLVGPAGPFPADYAYPRSLHWNGLDYELNPNQAPDSRGAYLGESGGFRIYAVPGKSQEREVAVGQQGLFFLAVHK